MEKQKNLWFSSLRGIGCIIVLLAHVCSMSHNYGGYFSGCGKIGVWLFMILGAFWFMYPLCQGKTLTPLALLKYYLGKFLRLYVVYIVVLIFAYMVHFIPSPSSFIRHVLLMEGMGHLWYMPVIVKFFLIAPLFWVIRNLIKRDLFLVGALTAIAVLLAIIFPFTRYTENSLQLGWYMPVFIMGMIVAISYSKEKDTITNGWFDLLAGITGTGILLITPVITQCVVHMEVPFYLQDKYLYIGFLWSVMILAISRGKYLKRILTKSHMLQWIGDISYPLYLTHFIIMFNIGITYVKWLPWAVSVIAISGIIACALHLLIEVPCVKLHNRVNLIGTKRIEG